MTRLILFSLIQDKDRYEKTGVQILTMCPDVTDTQLINKRFGRTLDAPGDTTEVVDQITAIPIQSFVL